MDVVAGTCLKCSPRFCACVSAIFRSRYRKHRYLTFGGGRPLARPSGISMTKASVSRYRIDTSRLEALVPGYRGRISVLDIGDVSKSFYREVRCLLTYRRHRDDDKSQDRIAGHMVKIAARMSQNLCQSTYMRSWWEGRGEGAYVQVLWTGLRGTGSARAAKERDTRQ